MEIIESNPPNINKIMRYLTPPDNAVFCYGDKIYNPSKNQVFEDIAYHEKVHSRQQESYTSPEVWWDKYLMDKEFRLGQEVEAYGEQYNYIKRKVPYKVSKIMLQEMAETLSTCYNLEVNKFQAETLIRKYAENN